MLITCPECQLQISDKAFSCPHCGYPMVTPEKQKRRPRQNRRKRLPNGFGQISEIKGKGLRRPFRAMVTVGKTDEGRPICKLLKPVSYFETYNDAYAALLEYNRNPYDLSPAITMAELFDRWSTEHFAKLSSSASAKNIRCAWKHCSGIYSMSVKDVRARHIKAIIEEAETSKNNKTLMKMVFNMMLDYAVEYELVDRNYARDFRIEKVDKSKVEGTGAHSTFITSEMEVLLSHTGESLWIDMAIIQCYSGFRPAELCALRTENINPMLRVMIGGSKTEAGKDRKVPIHSRILPLVAKYLDKSNGEFLFGAIDYEQYRWGFKKEMERLGLAGHTPHDCRVRFVTAAKEAGVNEYAIKLIVGHVIQDLTERVYTKRDFSFLLSEIEKIP